MVLLYTGASEFNREQPNHLLSRGGFISSTKVGNRFFDEISFNILNDRKNEYLGLVLKNTSGATRTNVLISWTYKIANSVDRMSNLSVAAVAFSGDKVEQLIDPFTEPNSIQGFHDGSVSPVLITSSFAVNATILLWFKRSVNTNFKIPKEVLDSEFPVYYKNIQEYQEEGFDLKIEYS